ncbi:hypothetical protein FRC18_006893 [Serendipita sp. 400]|nr:hypothetical protein FRC18_006893 [Serendipita sp. 400]
MSHLVERPIVLALKEMAGDGFASVRSATGWAYPFEEMEGEKEIWLDEEKPPRIRKPSLKSTIWDNPKVPKRPRVQADPLTVG